MTRTTARQTGLAGALLAGALVLAGCSDDPAHEGMSGMADSSSASASAEASADTSASFNDADVAFAQGMLPHHEGALEMAQLAGDRAADPRVLDLAARIEAAQAPEIDTLTGWLDEWGATAGSSSSAGMESTDHNGHDTGDLDSGMGDEMGMDIGALAAASGAEFDRLFLTQMIAHHQGAVAMAEIEIADGQNPDAIALAESIRDSQNAEIGQMQALLAELGG
jgi:uncharacterized protein (DUF305 family)